MGLIDWLCGSSKSKKKKKNKETNKRKYRSNNKLASEINSVDLEMLDIREFKDADMARRYIAKNEIFGSADFDFSRMSDKEAIDLANALLKQMDRVVGGEF